MHVVSYCMICKTANTHKTFSKQMIWTVWMYLHEVVDGDIGCGGGGPSCSAHREERCLELGVGAQGHLQ